MNYRFESELRTLEDWKNVLSQMINDDLGNAIILLNINVIEKNQRQSRTFYINEAFEYVDDSFEWIGLGWNINNKAVPESNTFGESDFRKFKVKNISEALTVKTLYEYLEDIYDDLEVRVWNSDWNDHLNLLNKGHYIKANTVDINEGTEIGILFN